MANIENSKNERLIDIFDLKLGQRPLKIKNEKNFYINEVLYDQRNLSKTEKENKWKNLTKDEKKIIKKRYQRFKICYTFKIKFLKKKINVLKREGQYKNLWNLFESTYIKEKIPEGVNRIDYLKKKYNELTDEQKNELKFKLELKNTMHNVYRPMPEWDSVLLLPKKKSIFIYAFFVNE